MSKRKRSETALPHVIKTYLGSAGVVAQRKENEFLDGMLTVVEELIKNGVVPDLAGLTEHDDILDGAVWSLEPKLKAKAYTSFRKRRVVFRNDLRRTSHLFPPKKL